MKGVPEIDSSDLDMTERQGQNGHRRSPLFPIEPMKIAILGSLPPLRALSSYCSALSLPLSELCKIEFISFKKIYPAFLYPGGDLKDDHSFPDMKHPNLRVWRRLTWYNPLSWIIEGLSKDADLLHIQWWSVPLILVYLFICLAFRLRRKPIVCTIHNIHPHERSFYSDLLSRMLFSLCNHFIVHSEANKTNLIKNHRINPEQVAVIPHGPLEFQTRGNLGREQVRKEMGFNTSNKVILLFGAIRSYKGIEISLKAFPKVLREVPEARLLIAGKLWEDWGPYARLMKELEISAYVRTFLQYIPSDKVGDLFQASDLVILPYHHFDSQSGVGATAIAFCKPMIVTDTGGLPELVMDRRNVVPPRDVDALADAIISCLQAPARLEQMSKDAEKIGKRISWPAIAEKTHAVYQKVLGIGCL
jgi:glycosyltransferase involved in cell wall biosynthesis